MSTNCFRTAIRFLAAVLFSASIAAPALAQQSGGQGTSDRFLDFFRRTELSGFVEVISVITVNKSRQFGPTKEVEESVTRALTATLLRQSWCGNGSREQDRC